MNLSPSQIPASCDTTEKLAAWAGLLLHRCNPTLKCIEAPGVTDWVAQASIFQADDGTTRLVIRLNFELEAGFAENNAKVWTQVKEFSEIAIPAGYVS